jgi:hypothetical protein
MLCKFAMVSLREGERKLTPGVKNYEKTPNIIQFNSPADVVATPAVVATPPAVATPAVVATPPAAAVATPEFPSLSSSLSPIND